MRRDTLHGILLVDKPAGPSSAAVVQEVRRTLHLRRAGHGGTLDPMATGVLPIGLGEGTKLAGFLLEADKEYEAEVLLGVATDTFDATGTVTATCDAGAVTEAEVRAALGKFVGRIRQRPPAFSAIKQAGRRLYERARAGEQVQAEEREVEIHRVELGGLVLPRVRMRVACSKGTYIRSLAHDLGQALGVGAHLTALRRMRAGRFRVEDAIPLAAVAAAFRDGTLAVISPAAALADLPAVRVPAPVEQAVRRGQPFRLRDLGAAPVGLRGRLAVLNGAGDLVAVVEAGGGPDERVSIVRGFNYTG